MLEGLPGAALAEGERLGVAAGAAQGAQQLRVVGGVHHNRHVLVVLGGGADHGGAADVNVLNSHLQGGRG